PTAFVLPGPPSPATLIPSRAKPIFSIMTGPSSLPPSSPPPTKPPGACLSPPTTTSSAFSSSQLHFIDSHSSKCHQTSLWLAPLQCRGGNRYKSRCRYKSRPRSRLACPVHLGKNCHMLHTRSA